MPLLTQTATLLVALRHIRIRKYHVQAGLAYGGAFLMGADFAVSAAPLIFPHLSLVLHGIEAGCGVAGKCGAAASGFSVFFDRIIAAGIAEESAG